jgi:DtxR family Mn-dependent transcriptional regulator
MENKRISPTIENYLCVLYILERDGEPIIGIQLAELFGVSPPTVTNTLKRMLRDNLLIEDENGLRLSEKGLEIACTVMRRHMLSEWMLSRMLSWSQVHEEAHEMEHAISRK